MERWRGGGSSDRSDPAPGYGPGLVTEGNPWEFGGKRVTWIAAVCIRTAGLQRAGTQITACVRGESAESRLQDWPNRLWSCIGQALSTPSNWTCRPLTNIQNRGQWNRAHLIAKSSDHMKRKGTTPSKSVILMIACGVDVCTWLWFKGWSLRCKFINTVQLAGQTDPSVKTLPDDAGLEYLPPVGLDVFLAYLLHVYMETMVNMHQSQSQKTVLWHPASQVRFEPSETTAGSLCICIPNWQCPANAQELLDIWKLIFITMLKTSQKTDRVTLRRSQDPSDPPLLNPPMGLAAQNTPREAWFSSFALSFPQWKPQKPTCEASFNSITFSVLFKARVLKLWASVPNGRQLNSYSWAWLSDLYSGTSGIK